MKSKQLAILTLVTALAPSSGALADQGTTADPAVMAAVNTVLSAAESGDEKLLREQYLPGVTVADAGAPAASTGPSAVDSYLPIALQMLKDSKDARIKLLAGKPKFSYEAGPTACVIVPLTVLAKVGGMSFTVSRSLALTLQKTAAGWKISTQALINDTAPVVPS